METNNTPQPVNQQPSPVQGELIPVEAKPAFTFDPDILRTQYEIVRWQRRVVIRESLLIRHRQDIQPFLDPLQNQVYVKFDNGFKKNRMISRTLHDQFMHCLSQVINVLMGQENFPQEKLMQFHEIHAEAEQLAELTAAEAEDMRKKDTQGNLKYVKQFS